MAQRISYLQVLVVVGACSAVPGCGLSNVSDQQAISGDGDEEVGDGSGGDRDDCKLEGARIGEVGASVDLGSVVVVVDSWIQKDGEPGEYIGFTFHTSTGATVAYTVKAGGESYDADTTTWMNPNGTGGPEVSAVSNVDFCDGCTDPDGCDPGDGGDGGDDGDGCTDPDGCDPGDGGEAPPIP